MFSCFFYFLPPIFPWSLLFSRLSSLVFCYQFHQCLDFRLHQVTLFWVLWKLWRVYSLAFSVISERIVHELRRKLSARKCFPGEVLGRVSFVIWKVEKFSWERSFDLENFPGLFRFKFYDFVPHHCLSWTEREREVWNTGYALYHVLC